MSDTENKVSNKSVNLIDYQEALKASFEKYQEALARSKKHSFAKETLKTVNRVTEILKMATESLNIEVENPELSNLYDHDYNLWQQKTIAALKNRDRDRLDWENLIIEIEEVGKSQKRALKSLTRRLIEHILKINYWETERERNLVHWRIEVENFREDIQDLLADSPSLKNYLQENYTDWYQKSVTKMKTKFPIPNDTALELNSLLDNNFFGDYPNNPQDKP